MIDTPPLSGAAAAIRKLMGDSNTLTVSPDPIQPIINYRVYKYLPEAEAMPSGPSPNAFRAQLKKMIEDDGQIAPSKFPTKTIATSPEVVRLSDLAYAAVNASGLGEVSRAQLSRIAYELGVRQLAKEFTP